MMADDFFVRALISGIGIAMVTGPLGCFIIWRRLAYFGDTLAHAALLGVALGLLFEANISLMVFVVSIIVSLTLVVLQRRATLSGDTLLGLLSHSALAIGLLAISFMAWVRVDMMSLLFGDILAVSISDTLIIWIGGAAIITLLIIIWRPLFAGTVNNDLATAEGMKYERANIIYMVLMAAVIAIAIKIVGVLLITAMLIIPAATARRFATGPEQMAIFAAVIGILSVIGGLFGSLEYDTPSGPSIVVAALVIFLLGLTPITKLFIRKKFNVNKLSSGGNDD